MRSAPQAALIGVLCVVLALVLLTCIALGSVRVPWSTTLQVLASHAGLTEPASPLDDRIVWELRVPRALAGALVGGALALAGAVLQATVRNPLADPQVLGASAGASAGAVAVLAFAGSAGLGLLSAGAFAGALVALALVLALGNSDRSLGSNQLVLAGVAVGAFFMALTSLLQYGADASKLQAMVFWLLGSLAGANWASLLWLTPAVLAAAVVLVRQAGRLDALLQGDDAASSLGIDPARLRLLLVFWSAVLTGAAIAVAGAIGFVGLVVPHVVRFLVGGAHHRLLVPTMLVGAAYLPLMDLLSRAAMPPSELPIGVLTALVGCPFFVVLLRRRASQS